MENIDLNYLLFHGASLSRGTQESTVSNIDVTKPYEPLEFRPTEQDQNNDAGYRKLYGTD
ncbi:hypothetical protein OHW64_07950 [Acinetobacter baumannii]|nr:hypothetical protein [Acinetobacter baumannii]